MRRGFARASAATASIRSIVITFFASCERIAAWYPLPAPISRTESVAFNRSSAVMSATIYGCDMVCPFPIGRGSSAYAFRSYGAGTKRWRGYFPHCGKHPGIGNAPCCDLLLHHPAPFVRSGKCGGHDRFLKSCFLRHIDSGIDLFLERLWKPGDLDIKESPDNCRSRFVLGKTPGHQVLDLFLREFSDRGFVGEFRSHNLAFDLRDRIDRPVF